MNSFLPLEKPNRLLVVDALRGLALFGILLANIPFSEASSSIYQLRNMVLGSPGTDKILGFAVHLLIDKKFITIFSILFGFGFYIQIKRAEEKGIAFRSYFVKRMILLLVIGCMHAYFFWFGDIIRDYAICGILLLLVYKWPVKRILITALIFSVFFTALVFILNTTVFFVIGLQLPAIMQHVKDGQLVQSIITALIISLVVILVRLFSGLFSSVFTRFIGRYITVAQRRPGWRNPVISSFVGMRGVVSLASALSVPLLLPGGRAFPSRDIILFITFIVIIITLVGQGLLLPWLIRRVKPQFLAGEKTNEQQILEIETRLYQSAISKLNEKYVNDIENNEILRNRHELYNFKVQLLSSDCVGEKIAHFKKIMIEVIEHERRVLHSFRKKKGYDDDVIRIIENRLDLEEERLEEETE